MYNMDAIISGGNALSAFPGSDSACRLAEMGFALIPIPFGEKGPRIASWQTNWTKDPDTVAHWFIHGASNVGMVTGSASGVIVLDVDGPEGLATLAELQEQNGPLPDGPIAETGSGGRHYLMRAPTGSVIKNKVKFLPGLDVRGENGQIVVEPSIHPNGKPYRWLCAPWEAELPEIPEWLLSHILSPEPKPKTRSPAKGETIVEGGRNDTLFREASRLRAQGFDEEQVLELLQLHNKRHCKPPLSSHEVANIAQSAMRYDPNDRYDRNDAGNGQRFADAYRDRVRYSTDIGQWFIWDGRVWAADTTGGITRLALALISEMKIDAENIADPVVRKGAVAWAIKSGDRPRLKAMIDIAASDKEIAVASTAFDNLTGLLPVANGVVDLTTGELLPHDRSRLFTKLVDVDYVPGARGAHWQAVLNRALAGELQQFAQTYLGYALHGEPKEQHFVVWQGRGANGKSTIADAVAHILGPFAVRTPSETFLAADDKNKGGPRADLIALQGARLVLASEVASRRKLDAVTVKSVTGDGEITARAPFGRTMITFPVTFTVAMLTNPLPGAHEGDGALWRRLLLLPFDNVIPKAERDSSLGKKIREEESQAVLAWLVEGAVRYANEGLSIPEAMIERTKAWRREVGSIERFVREVLDPEAGASLPLKALHARYQGFCYQNQIQPPYGIETMRERLAELGFIVSDEVNNEVVHGLRWRAGK